MSKLLRNLLAFGAVMAAFIAVVHVQPTWAATLTLDLWNIVELEQTIESQVRKGQVLDEQFELALQRCHRRRHIVDDIIAGRTTLLQAAVEFRSLNEGLPASRWSYNQAYAGKSEGERLCRYVIRLVQADLSERTPTLAAAKAEKLEEELHVLLEQDGIVHLPPD
jgi:hypothetical protein